MRQFLTSSVRPILLILGILVATSGCQHIQLREHTVRQASTLTDLQYQVVLDNLAMLYSNHEMMPYYLNPSAGLSNIQITGQASVVPGWDLLSSAGKVFSWHFDKVTSTFTGTDQMVEQWNTTPATNPEELILMRCVYLKALGIPCEDPECEKRLTAFYAHDPAILKNVVPGWFGAGKKKDVPIGASHVGHYGHCYVWVNCDEIEGLTKLTLAILDIATAQPPIPHDPLQSKILALEAKAKTLSDLYKSTDTTKQEPPDAKALRNELNEVLKNLAAAEELQRKQEAGTLTPTEVQDLKAPRPTLFRKPQTLFAPGPVNIPVP